MDPAAEEKLVKEYKRYSQMSQQGQGENRFANLSKEERNQMVLNHYDKRYNDAEEAHKSMQRRQNTHPPMDDVPNVLSLLLRSAYVQDIASLKEITVDHLELKRNEGHYFKGKVVKKPWKMPGPTCGVNTILEDNSGEMVRVNFYSVSKSEDWNELEKIFPIGREIVILHPFYKIALDGFPSICVENRFEFYFGDEAPLSHSNFDEIFEKSKVFKDQANKELKTNYNSALNNYFKSVKVLLKEVPKLVADRDEFALDWTLVLQENEKKLALEHLSTVFSNCSFLYLHNKHQPLMALYYAKFSKWCNPSFFKATLREAKALITLLRLHEAQSLLENAKDRPEASQFQDEIGDMLNETAGLIRKYSSPETIVQFFTGKLNWDDETSYIGPIELFDEKISGRGYRAMRDIAQGETLLIEKGFVYPQNNPAFTYELLNKLNRREDLKASYMNLFPTRRYPVGDLSQDVNKGWREYGAKVMFNTLRSAHPREWESFTEAEVNELLCKALYDSFGVRHEYGMFPHCCLLNHSCDPNTSIWHHKDMVLLMARKDIKKGEEIFVTYAPLIEKRTLRKRRLLSFFGFDCSCNRCEKVGEWKEKEARISGIGCHTCTIALEGDDKDIFTCPKCGWKSEETFYPHLVKTSKILAERLEKCSNEKEQEKLLEQLEMYDGPFYRYNVNRVPILAAKARFYLQKGDEEQFIQHFLAIYEISEYDFNYELLFFAISIIPMIPQALQRNPHPKEFSIFKNFGLPLDAVAGLWKEACKSQSPLAFMKALEPSGVMDQFIR